MVVYKQPDLTQKENTMMWREWTLAFAPVVVEVLAILVAVVCIWKQIQQQRILQKQNNGISIMMAFSTNPELMQALLVSAEIHNAPEEKVEDYAEEAPPNASDEKEWLDKRRNLFLLVNYLEMVSVGIKSNIYDRKIIYDSAKTIFTQTYERMEPFMKRRRRLKHIQSFGENFEQIAQEFSAPQMSKPAR